MTARKAIEAAAAALRSGRLPPKHQADIFVQKAPGPNFDAYARMVANPFPCMRQVERVLMATALHFGIGVNALRSSKRTADFVLPRQVYCFIARMDFGYGFAAIGKAVGGRDHTTALHGFRQIQRLRDEREDVAAAVEAIRAMLGRRNAG